MLTRIGCWRSKKLFVEHADIKAGPDQTDAATGFEVEATFGGFGGEAYDEDESDHLIFAARLRD